MSKIAVAAKKGTNYLASGGLRQIFIRINQAGIKKGVDSQGIDKFINQCALMAAGSGAIAGAGGIATMAVGIPLDMVNLVTQQFRVTLAVSYYKTGKYKVEFDDFIRIVGASLKVDAGLAATKNIIEEVAEKLLMNMGAKAARRIVPVVGAVLGGTVNYLFIKKVAKGLIGEGN